MGAGAGLVTGHALADPFEDRAQERGGSCIQHWESPQRKVPSYQLSSSRRFNSVKLIETFTSLNVSARMGRASSFGFY